MIYEKMIQHFFCADIYYIMKISEQKRRRYGNLKKNILILAALIAVVLAVPFLIIKADEAIQIKNAEFKEKQNNVCYEKAGECMDAGEYDEAIELLEKLPGNYEDAEYIIRYAKFCKAVQNEEGIEELHKLIWNFPKEDKYSGKYAEEMKRVKEDTEVQYEKYMAQKEKEEEEKMRKKDEPYKGMKEKYINITLLGRAKEKRTLLAGYTGKKDTGYSVQIYVV